MSEYRTEGVILKSTPYEELHRILSVFTQDRGMVRLFVSHAERTRRWTVESLTPLTRVLVVYDRRREDTLSRLRDAKPLDQYLPLRTRWDRLEAAGSMGHTLLTSQLPDKAAPKLYELLLRFLTFLCNSESTDVLWSSFHLKFLLHEGLLPLKTRCARCSRPLEQAGIFDGELFCAEHIPPDSLFLEQQELEAMILLAGSRKLSEILAIKVSSRVKSKVRLLLESAMS